MILDDDGGSPTERFPYLHRLAVAEDEVIKWHSFAASENSSQALCLSAFGSLRSPEFDALRNRLVGGLVGSAFPTMQTRDRPRRWMVSVEVEDPELLSEFGSPNAQPTSIDALFVSRLEVVAVEAKFDSDAAKGFGTCGQYDAGKCAGFRGVGSDLKRKTPAWCRLETWDGQRSPRNYWAFGKTYFQPWIFREQSPAEACALRGSNYQLMRNFLFAAAYATKHRKSSFAVMAVCPRNKDKVVADQIEAFRTDILLASQRDRIRVVHYEDWIALLSEGANAVSAELATFLRDRIKGVLSR